MYGAVLLMKKPRTPGKSASPRVHSRISNLLRFLRRPFFTEYRFYPQLMNCLNDDTQVMAEDLTEHLIELPYIAFAAYGIPKFGLDHAKSRFDVRPLVIMR